MWSWGGGGCLDGGVAGRGFGYRVYGVYFRGAVAILAARVESVILPALAGKDPFNLTLMTRAWHINIGARDILGVRFEQTYHG